MFLKYYIKALYLYKYSMISKMLRKIKSKFEIKII